MMETTTGPPNVRCKTYYRYLNLSPGKKLLDLGTGYFHWTRFCQDRGVRVEGATLSKSQVEVCKEYGIHAHLQDFRLFIAREEALHLIN